MKFPLHVHTKRVQEITKEKKPIHKDTRSGKSQISLIFCLSGNSHAPYILLPFTLCHSNLLRKNLMAFTGWRLQNSKLCLRMSPCDVLSRRGFVLSGFERKIDISFHLSIAENLRSNTAFLSNHRDFAGCSTYPEAERVEQWHLPTQSFPS